MVQRVDGQQRQCHRPLGAGQWEGQIYICIYIGGGVSVRVRYIYIYEYIYI